MQPHDPGMPFTEGANHYESFTELLWDPAATHLVDFAQLKPGQTVLDAACGSGAVTLPMARAVGEAGAVDGVDLSTGLLTEAGKKLSTAGILHTTLTQADVTRWRGHRQYDAVLCSYGVFFFDPMDTAVEHLISLLRPGGRLVLNTWAAGALSPLADTLTQAAATERPRLAGVTPVATANMATLNTAAKLSSWLSDRGLSEVEVVTIPWKVELDVESAWNLVLGTGWRTLLPREPEAIGRVRQTFTDRLRELGEPVEFTFDTLLAKGTAP